MAMFDSHEELTVALSAQGVECRVADDFVELPIPETNLTGTLQIVEGWLVFKVYLGDWDLGEAALRTRLRLQDRLIGFRFSWVSHELWALQDFPVVTLSDDLAAYLRSAFWVLEAVTGSVIHYLTSDAQIRRTRLMRCSIDWTPHASTEGHFSIQTCRSDPSVRNRPKPDVHGKTDPSSSMYLATKLSNESATKRS